MPAIYTPLLPYEYAALSKLAQQERRDPRAQAAFIIRRELERLGLLDPPAPLADARAEAEGGAK